MSAAAEEHPSEGAPEWMVSYADMITILMSFFVVMFSMAGSKDTKKEVPVLMSLRRQFGRFVGLPANQYVPTDSALTTKNVVIRPTPTKETRNRGLVGEHARVSTIRPGDQATIGGVIFFDAGVSDLNDEQRRDLQTTATELGGKPQKIEIRGHTLGRPPQGAGKVRDNWDLAYERCYKTMRYLVSLGIDPRRIRIGVAAQFEPVYAGRDPRLLEKNSRVEVFMLNEFTEDGRGMIDDGAVE
ncbi:MAG TPA: flagellar motor protein MotB [Pirellulales bacterium]|jgi:chemotaxis protein MotB|nr:flagellar motor protein MotB [Pirellulales bacterium]